MPSSVCVSFTTKKMLWYKYLLNSKKCLSLLGQFNKDYVFHFSPFSVCHHQQGRKFYGGNWQKSADVTHFGPNGLEVKAVHVVYQGLNPYMILHLVISISKKYVHVSYTDTWSWKSDHHTIKLKVRNFLLVCVYTQLST